MEEVERVAYEKYKIIKKQMKNADNETIAILMAINSLSTQLEREIQVEDMEKELEILTPCLSPHGLEFLYWLPKRSLYASLLRGFSHYRHVRRGLFL